MPKRYLFFVQLPYSFAILRPLQNAILANGDEVKWFLTKGAPSAALEADEQQLNTVEEVKAYNPRAVFVPGNVVPDFFPGVKVQVFHGLEYKKKGHFGIRGFFDLYCTHGPLTTKPFQKLANKHGYFKVIETGWPKLDPYFDYQKPVNNKPVILYAPTFSPNLTSLGALYQPLKALVETGRYEVKVKFHPKTSQQFQLQYRKLCELDGFAIADSANLIPLIQQADLVISDTSSAVDESLLIGKPVVTFNNTQPQAALINITEATKLQDAVQVALNLSPDQQLKINNYIEQVHPLRDGQSAARVLAATEQVIATGVQAKPWNIIRRYKVRKALNYMKLR